MKHLLSSSINGRFCKLICFLFIVRFLLPFSLVQARTMGDEPIIVMKTDKKVNDEIAFTLASLDGESSPIQIDWGNGVLSKGEIGREITGKLPVDGATIKIYGNGGIVGTVTCNKNEFTILDVSKLINLETLNCDVNKLTELNVGTLTKLKQLCCQANKITSLDISSLTQLTLLYCFDNEINLLDLSKNTQLSKFDCSRNKLTSLKLKGAISLERLTFDSNFLTSVDMSGLENVTILRCENNPVTSLDLSPLVSLTSVYCRNNPTVTSLNVKDHSALKTIYATNMGLTTLDVSGIASLTRLDCGKSNLTSLIIDNNPNLARVSCDSNYLKLNALPYPNFSTSYTYAPQKPMKMGLKMYYVGDEVNLSDQYKVKKGSEDVITTYAWKKKDGTVLVSGTDYTEDMGVFTFNAFDSIYCEMSNTVFPALKLKTENIRIEKKGTAPKVIEMKTDKLANEEIVINLLTLNAESSTVQIDWGNEVTTEVQTGEIKGVLPVGNAIIKIYGNSENIIGLTCSKNKLTVLDVSALTNLENLSCDENSLTTLNVNGLTKLKKLNCQKNKLTALTVKEIAGLNELNIADNLLTSIDFTGLTGVTTLRCENNLLASIDLMPMTSLSVVYCNNNKPLANIKVKNHPALKLIYANYCGLKTLDVSGVQKLTDLECGKNSLGSLVIDNNPDLAAVVCDNNSLKLNTLPYPKFFTQYIYFPQKEVKMTSKSYKSTDTVDLSDQYKIKNGNQPDAVTTYVWKKEDGTVLVSGSDYREEQGRFTFNKFDSIYCEMANPVFPELKLKTEKIHVEEWSAIESNVQDNKAAVYIDRSTLELNVVGFEMIDKVNVFDLSGILKECISSQDLPFDMSDYKPGIYLLTVKTISGVYTYKVVLN